MISLWLNYYQKIVSPWCLIWLVFCDETNSTCCLSHSELLASVISDCVCGASLISLEVLWSQSQVQAKKKRNEAVFQEKLRLELERLYHMSSLTYKNGTVHEGQAEGTDQTVWYAVTASSLCRPAAVVWRKARPYPMTSVCNSIPSLHAGLAIVYMTVVN
jgi:hypothetical protein